MPTDVQNCAEPTMTSLLTGIVNDAQRLMTQQLTLFQHELKKDVREAKEGLPSLGLGLGLLLVAAFLLGITLAELLGLVPALHDLAWVRYGIVTLVFAAVGGGLLWVAVRRLKKIPMSEPAAEATKENVEWLTHPTQPQ
jgi:putative exporter of polyketide antibiotics